MNDISSSRKLRPVKEAARIFGVPPRTIRKINNGEWIPPGTYAKMILALPLKDQIQVLEGLLVNASPSVAKIINEALEIRRRPVGKSQAHGGGMDRASTIRNHLS